MSNCKGASVLSFTKAEIHAWSWHTIPLSMCQWDTFWLLFSLPHILILLIQSPFLFFFFNEKKTFLRFHKLQKQDTWNFLSAFAGQVLKKVQESLWTTDLLNDSLPAHFYQNSDKWIDFPPSPSPPFLILFEFWEIGNNLVLVSHEVLLTTGFPEGASVLVLENRRCQTQTRFHNNAIT